MVTNDRCEQDLADAWSRVNRQVLGGALVMPNDSH